MRPVFRPALAYGMLRIPVIARKEKVEGTRGPREAWWHRWWRRPLALSRIPGVQKGTRWWSFAYKRLSVSDKGTDRSGAERYTRHAVATAMLILPRVEAGCH